MRILHRVAQDSMPVLLPLWENGHASDLVAVTTFPEEASSTGTMGSPCVSTFSTRPRVDVQSDLARFERKHHVDALTFTSVNRLFSETSLVSAQTPMISTGLPAP